MQAKDLELIKGYFSKEGAGVRPGQVQADGRVKLEVVYQHTAPHIRGVNELLNKAQKWTGVTVQEDSHDREHRQIGAKQMTATMNAERAQSKGQSKDRGQSR
jgi:predicted secreted Zn-dependent protease